MCRGEGVFCSGVRSRVGVSGVGETVLSVVPRAFFWSEGIPVTRWDPGLEIRPSASLVILAVADDDRKGHLSGACSGQDPGDFPRERPWKNGLRGFPLDRGSLDLFLPRDRRGVSRT